MRSAVDLPAFGDFADLALLTRAAVLAEEAGWDRFALWDHINWPFGAPVAAADAWLAAAVAAAATTRIRIAVWVCPLPRRLPQEVARQAVTLHNLSGGRFELGVGSGGGGPFDAAEFGSFALATDATTRGEQLDESLAVIVGLWSGQQVDHHGAHYTVDGVTFTPAAPYHPGGGGTIPIWVGGTWGRPRPLRRAARYDGYAPIRMDGQRWTPQDLHQITEQLHTARPAAAQHRARVTLAGSTTTADTARLAELDDAGLDWWSETLTPWELSSRDTLNRIARGPMTQ